MQNPGIPRFTPRSRIICPSVACVGNVLSVLSRRSKSCFPACTQFALQARARWRSPEGLPQREVASKRLRGRCSIADIRRGTGRASLSNAGSGVFPVADLTRSVRSVWGAHAPRVRPGCASQLGSRRGGTRHRALNQARWRARARWTRASTAAREGARAFPIAETQSRLCDRKWRSTWRWWRRRDLVWFAYFAVESCRVRRPALRRGGLHAVANFPPGGRNYQYHDHFISLRGRARHSLRAVQKTRCRPRRTPE